uniref:MAU2 chromatid cohesion factor homolog n=1 Tax=Equus caballus TaxID=9796 RepID=A0A3Q2HX31_HORSE
MAAQAAAAAAQAAAAQAAQAEAAESWYLALLGFAEHFRTSSPPKIRLCVHCLQAVFPFKPPQRIEARTHLQLGSVLYHHTKNSEQARSHLEKAWLISQQIPQFEDVKFEAASLLSELYCQENSVDAAKPLLRKAIQISQQTPYWHCRLLFQLAQLHTLEKDLVSACDLLGVGAEYARVVGSEYTRALFLLSKGMLLLMERKLQEVHPLLTLCGQIVENWQGNPIQKESLRVFFLVLQVTHYLDAGQVKSVKPCLKQLQQCIQTISTLHDDEILPSNPADLFHWLPKEHMCVLVYLVTVMHSMQAGYLEKAQKYTDKALMQLEKLKMLDCSPILSSFQVILLEHIIMCRLVTGHKATALQEISQVCQLCQQSPRLFSNHAAQLHTLLGLYCVSVNCMDNAEAQFTTALRLTNHQELWAFIVTNLASVYIREGNRHQEVVAVQFVGKDQSRPQLPCQVGGPRRVLCFLCSLGWCEHPWAPDFTVYPDTSPSTLPFYKSAAFTKTPPSCDVLLFPQLSLPPSGSFLCAWALLLLPGTLQRGQAIPARNSEDVQCRGPEPAHRLLPRPPGPHLLCVGEPQGE